MGTCEVCGNQYDKAFTVTTAGKNHTFDSFACAIHMLAPRCNHCKVTIIGHGMEARGQYFCCAHCKQTFDKDPMKVLEPAPLATNS
jgi:hypothetical protein